MYVAFQVPSAQDTHAGWEEFGSADGKSTSKFIKLGGAQLMLQVSPYMFNILSGYLEIYYRSRKGEEFKNQLLHSQGGFLREYDQFLTPLLPRGYILVTGREGRRREVLPQRNEVSKGDNTSMY